MYNLPSWPSIASEHRHLSLEDSLFQCRVHASWVLEVFFFWVVLPFLSSCTLGPSFLLSCPLAMEPILLFHLPCIFTFFNQIFLKCWLPFTANVSAFLCRENKPSPPGGRLQVGRKSQFATPLKAARLHNLGNLDDMKNNHHVPEAGFWPTGISHISMFGFKPFFSFVPLAKRQYI